MQIIEFLGMPRAGKTTQIEKLRRNLEKQGLAVCVIGDRGREQSIATPPNESLAYVIVLAAQALDRSFCYAESDLLIIDRGIGDTLVWADVYYDLGAITTVERDAIKSIFKRYREKVDITFYFNLSPEQALQRHQQQKVNDAPDEIAMNKPFLEKLHQCYKKNISFFTNAFPIDGALPKTYVEAEVLGITLERLA